MNKRKPFLMKLILYMVYMVKQVTYIFSGDDWSYLPWFLFFVLVTLFLIKMMYKLMYYFTFMWTLWLLNKKAYNTYMYMGQMMKKWEGYVFLSVWCAMSFLQLWMLQWYHNIVDYGWVDSFWFFGGFIGLKLFIHVVLYIILVELIFYFWSKDEAYWENWPWW